MSSDPWLAIYTVLLPSLTGLTLLFLLHHVLAFWRVERRSTALALALVYCSQFVLFLMYSLHARLTPLVGAGNFIQRVVIASYLFLTVSMAVANFLEWRTLLGQLWRKEVAPPEPVAEAMVTLKDASGKDVVLEAIDKDAEQA